MLQFTKEEKSLFQRLNTPAKVQDFLNSIPANFESDGWASFLSPVMVLRQNKAHCFEGAVLGAYILSLHGYKPLILHLKARKPDWDHVVAPFKQNGYWGALSKTNHAVLRYREPVYKNIRELVMSYFHEYFTDDGKKNLESYTDPLNLNIFSDNWAESEDPLWGIDEALDEMKHNSIIHKKTLKNKRLADKIEIQAGKLVEWKKGK